MQIAITAGAVSSAANPLLDIWIQKLISTDPAETVAYALGAPVALAFQIFDVSTEAKLQAPLQVFPVTPGNKQSVHLTNDRIATLDGHYAAAWTAPAPSSTTAYGRYEIRWFYTLTAGGPEVVVRREFDVLAAYVAPSLVGGYCLVSDLRDEGLRACDAADVRALRMIDLASRYIERVTGRFFEPRYLTARLSGSGGRAVQTGDPIIALAGINLGNPAGEDVGPEGFRVFNRHIVDGLRDPDDRDDPKVEFVHYRDHYAPARIASVSSPLFGVPWRDLYFPAGVANVNVRGLFGYTDYDGSSMGATPTLIRHVCKLLALREAPALTSSEREDKERYRLTSERTRDQSYTLAAPTMGEFTGDTEIDDVLLMFMRPMRLGCV